MFIYVWMGIFPPYFLIICDADIISADFVLRVIIKNYTAIIFTYYYKRLVRRCVKYQFI